jgi:predicted SnoaL-like aldol condensation-catalyzing enzyme
MSPDSSNAVEKNKQVVLDFFDKVFKQREPAEAAKTYLAPSYKQHNPTAPDGPDGFGDLVGGMFAAFPDADLDIKRVIGEGDLVVLHHHLKMNAEDRGTAVMDIFRVKDGQIVEHWDVLQPVPEEAANDNTMF